MRHSSLLPVVAVLPCLAAELPPVIPTGPVQYGEVTYEPALTPAYNGGLTEAPATDTYTAPAAPNTYAPISTPSSAAKGYLNLNAYSSNYQVRGMGLTDMFGHHGYSSLSGNYILPNRNLLGLGIQQSLGGELGQVWGADDILGDTPVVRFDYAVGKEIFPNLMAEAGYSLHHGGMEGLFAHAKHACPHRLAQDANLALRFDDRQRGFFGHAVWGIGFQGLTGSYFDVEAGYRFTNVLSLGNLGADAEISAGVAPSLGYWGSGVEGVDAYRIKLALPLFTHNGTMGHDAPPYVRPWCSVSWSGSNAAKMDRAYGCSPVDHAQFTIGIDLGWNF